MTNSELQEQLNSQRQMLEDSLKELRRQNQNLKKALAKVEIRNEELAEIAYQTSHDMRGPVATLLGLTQLMKAEENPEIAMGFFDEVPDLLQKIDVFSRSLSAYSQTINLPLKREKINWNDIVNNALKQIGKECDIQLEVKESAKFYSHTERITILLHHLLTNSLKFNPNKKDLEIKLEITASDKEAQLHYNDNGIGIDEKVRDSIFNMFYRGSQHIEGSGLGLYITQSIVKELEGKIQLVHTSQKGAAFKITIPQMEAAIDPLDIDF